MCETANFCEPIVHQIGSLHINLIKKMEFLKISIVSSNLLNKFRKIYQKIRTGFSMSLAESRLELRSEKSSDAIAFTTTIITIISIATIPSLQKNRIHSHECRVCTTFSIASTLIIAKCGKMFILIRTDVMVRRRNTRLRVMNHIHSAQIHKHPSNTSSIHKTFFGGCDFIMLKRKRGRR